MLNPLVSIIIPAYNEQDVIGRLLKSVKNQSYKNIETIVVDDNSSDSTLAISKKYTKLAFHRQHAERSVQRNFGANKSKGQYFLFLDADMELTPEVVSECVAKIQGDTSIGAIAIPELPIASNYLEKVKAFERSFYSDFGDPDTDAARFFTHKAFMQAGGYDETLIGPEDWDLPETISKLGYKIDRVHTLVLHYERVPSLLKLAKKKYYYALTSHRYFAKHHIAAFGPKTIYFLRPIFYRNWEKLIKHPLLTLGLIVVLTIEQIAGGIGYVVGKYKSL
mgnify:CR=1 FL=1